VARAPADVMDVPGSCCKACRTLDLSGTRTDLNK